MRQHRTATITEMKPRTTTSADVTAPPEQSQLEVCNIEDEIGILHRQPPVS